MKSYYKTGIISHLNVVFYLLCLTLPFRDWPKIEVMNYGFTFRVFDIFTIVFCTLFVAALMLRKIYPRFPKPFIFLIVFFFIGQVFFMYLGLDNGGNLRLIIREGLWTVLFFLLLILIYSYLTNPSYNVNIKHPLKWVLISFGIVNLAAIAMFFSLPQYYPITSNSELWIIGNVEIRRFYGLASEPGYWANIMIFPAFLSFYILFSKKLRDEFCLTGISYFFILANIAGFFLTFATVAIGFLGIFIAVNYFFFARKRWTFYLIVFTFLLGIALILSPSGQAFLGESVKKVSQPLSTTSSYERMAWRDAALGMFKESPFIGFGIGQYTNCYMDFTDFEVRDAWDANSLYMLYLAERGIVGIVLIIALLLTIVVYQFKMVIYSRGAIRLVACTFLVTTLCYISYFYITGILWLYYFWFFTGLSMGLRSQCQMILQKQING